MAQKSNHTSESTRARLASGEVLLGGWIQIPHPAVARVLASSGLDWVAVDCEHGVVDLDACERVISAIRECGVAPWVRLPGNEYGSNKRYLDAGASGLIAPLVNTPEDARNLVRSAKYPPDGDRGVGYCAANNYGFAFDDYIRTANDEILCCVQIEHQDGIANLEAICTTPGVDAAFIGPYDLSASLGATGDFEHKDFRAALDRFLKVCKDHGVAPGIHVVNPDPDEVLRRVEEGYRLIAYSLDVTLLGHSARQGVETIRKALK